MTKWSTKVKIRKGETGVIKWEIVTNIGYRLNCTKRTLFVVQITDCLQRRGISGDYTATIKARDLGFTGYMMCVKRF